MEPDYELKVGRKSLIYSILYIKQSNFLLHFRRTKNVFAKVPTPSLCIPFTSFPVADVLCSSKCWFTFVIYVTITYNITNKTTKILIRSFTW